MPRDAVHLKLELSSRGPEALLNHVLARPGCAVRQIDHRAPSERPGARIQILRSGRLQYHLRAVQRPPHLADLLSAGTWIVHGQPVTPALQAQPAAVAAGHAQGMTMAGVVGDPTAA